MVRVLDSDDVRRLVSMADAIAAVREAFAAADRGGAVMPAPFGMYLPDAGGEVHVKGGRLAGRTADDELTVADLTGLGIQDAAVAALAARLAGEHGAGRDVRLGDW